MKANLISIVAIAIIFVIEIQHPINAFEKMHTTVPLEVLIQNSDNPQATILNMRDTLIPGYKLVSPNQPSVLMFNPNNLNEPATIVDIKKAISKFVLQHPEILQNSEIIAKDFSAADFSAEELSVLSREPMTLAEQNLLATIIHDFTQGNYLLGGRYCLDGGWEIVKGTAKINVGLSILLKKMLFDIYNFTCKICTKNQEA